MEQALLRSSAAYGDAVNSLKAKFRALDANRDGMLDREELAVLLRRGLPDITDREVRGLFLCVDTDGSGAVLFDEFVDFLFDPPDEEDLPADTRPPRALVDARELEMLRVMADGRRGSKEPPLGHVEIHGASYELSVNGVYFRKKTQLNGHPVFSREDPPCALFFGWTPGRRRVGWFIAGRAPPTGPVMKYTMCNQSPAAETPDLCCAMWETFGGNHDKHMFCLATDASADELDEGTDVDEASESGILEHELSKPGPLAGHTFCVDDEFEKLLEEEIGEDLEDIIEEPGHGEYLGLTDTTADAAVDVLDFGPGFMDPEFMPEESSLGSSQGIHDFDPSLCVANRWTRLPQLHQTPCLFHRGVAPDDICCAESAANRWFLSACVAAAEFPAWVQSMFGQSTELDPQGRYSVRLYHPGRRGFLHVTVDDLVPTKNGFPAFAGITIDGELWVALVEKAFAKLCGSYENTSGGSTAFGLLYLCGGGAAESWSSSEPGKWRRSHTEWRKHTVRASAAAVDRQLETMVEDWAVCDVNEFWTLLRSFTNMCYPVACAVKPAQAAACGLSLDRTYPLVSTREVLLDGRMLRMVFLREPFGVSGWRGRWSNDSDLWTRNPAIRKALQFKPTGDGTFWMSFYDFARYFQTVDVVKKAMPLQGCHSVKLAEFRTDDSADSCSLDLPSLPTSP